MEAEEENGLNLKRQRRPLSDSEDNILSSDINDRQKRRRLEATGQENCSPKASSSGRLAELQTKPDTPMIPSVRSRVQQLTQQREGGIPQPQRCLSDPGSDNLSVISHNKGFREHLLGEREFNQRMERFKLPDFQTSPSPTPSPDNRCRQTRSTFVSNIHHKLQDTTTPSSKQVSRIRQEREQELNQLQFQPISENAWLKRSSSDPLLTQERTPAGSGSSPSSWVPRSKRRVQWPPMQSWDVSGDDTEMQDGSFTETVAEKPSVKPGPRTASTSEAPTASAKCRSPSKVQKQNTHHGEEIRENTVSAGNVEEHIVTQQQETETVMMLSFSEDQSFSKAVFSQNVSGLSTTNQQSFFGSTSSDKSDVKEAKEFSKVSEDLRSEVFSLGEDEKIDILSSEEEIEPSTDEEFKMWRYPRLSGCKDEPPILSEEDEVLTEEGEGKLGQASVDKENTDGFTNHTGKQQGGVSAVEVKEDDEPKEKGFESAGCFEHSVKERESIESCGECCEGIAPETGDFVKITQEQKNTVRCAHVENDVFEQSQKSQSVDVRENIDLLSDSRGQTSVKQTIAQTECIEIKGDIEESSHMGGNDKPLDHLEVEHESGNERQDVADELTDASHKAVGGDCSKKVTFILEPELINSSTLSESNTSMESKAELGLSDAELSSHDETNTAEIIDQMFEEVLEYAGRMEEERRDDEDTEDRDSGIGACSVDKDKMDTESEKEKSEEEGEAKEEEEFDESKQLESNTDELLTFPPSGILSPLSKSVEAVVTPLRLAVSQESNPPSLLLTPEETSTPPAESAPLYSIDAYRTQRQSKLPTIQSVTPGVQRRAAEISKPQPSVNAKEKISALNEEAVKLQTVINQTLQALSCCTDEVHGRGSLEEAEAEKLLLVTCEKRAALLAEVARLREERSSESGEAAEEDKEYVTQQPCRGTVNITNIQLPLKVEFVCSSHNRAGRPSHYFFILVRYGPCNIVATPLATAADAQNGDTISFPTSVTLKDIRSSFEIDVEVYSLSHASASNSSMDRTTTKPRVTPRKLLNTITRSSNSLTTATLPALNTRRSSNFFLVGSHKITLASLGHSKFPLDKMKLDGKIRRLLGDEFQEKVPFLSPLEGNIYLKLESESHSNVQHQGFLTKFELISGYGVWHRRYFVLEGCNMNYWNHPNDKETKEAEGSISLSSSPSQCVRPVKRDSCARPFTFELVNNIPQQQDLSQDVLAKCWFSADTKQERLDWMEKLNQALLDFHTWNRTETENEQSNTSSSGNLRESIL